MDKVVFCGAGRHVLKYYEDYCSKYGEPICFIDSNRGGRGETIFGKDILPLDARTISRVGDATIILTVSIDLQNELKCSLLNAGVAEKNIIDYETVKAGLCKKYECGIGEYGLNKSEKREANIIVSFTSYPERIECAKYVADSMLRQSVKPDKLILVLSKDEFPNKELPADYDKLEQMGLEIRFVDGNVRQFKKFLYTFPDYPQDINIIVDDDVFYPETIIEWLCESYKKYPNAISAGRTAKMPFQNNRMLPYSQWELDDTVRYIDTPVLDRIGIGFFGVLYPPHSLYEDAFNLRLIQELGVRSDDIWLKFMSLLTGTPVAGIPKLVRPIFIGNSQETALSKHADRPDGDKDYTLKKICEYYNLNGDRLLALLRQDKEVALPI